MTAIGARVLRTRRLVRAPIWLYRAGLGILFGSRLLMLEHIGRTTGAPVDNLPMIHLHLTRS
ncbi:hypothetical protein ABZT47_10295 [Sphaerisporangium sp. NPDC005289]|uniref:hypothetical protein n=1 Tax=Sphaerisporangium sp. NPDC005289 TaxID=3155247 RepID=UPI0033A37E4C